MFYIYIFFHSLPLSSTVGAATEEKAAIIKRLLSGRGTDPGELGPEKTA